MEWQPIETAPRDGTDVLLFVPWKGKDVMAVGWWAQAIGGHWCLAGGVEIDTDIFDYADPTYWMPLPDPPIAPAAPAATQTLDTGPATK